MLKITNLKSGYEKMEVLKGIDFSVGKNEIVAVVGPNGAGKSTLLKSIFNQCEIYAGKIELQGKNIGKFPAHELIQKGVSYSPQGRQIFNNLTVEENLEMGGFIFKDKKFINKKIKFVLEEFPFLKEKLNNIASSLSGGQQQMLSIGRTLVQDPKLLLLDEPSLGLSPKMMKEVFQKIIEIKRKNVSIIIVEQNAKQAIEIADKIYILKNGFVDFVGNKNELLKSDKLKHFLIYSQGI